jgi:hypothetical protein
VQSVEAFTKSAPVKKNVEMPVREGGILLVEENRAQEDAIRAIKLGCDMSDFGDALAYQIEVRQDRALPYRD